MTAKTNPMDQFPRKRPVLAIATFIAPFLITGVMLLFQWESPIAVIPFVSLAFSCTILCLQLIGGDLVPFRFLILVVLMLTIFVGRQWYLPLFLMTFTAGTLLAMDWCIGRFIPLLPQSDNSHYVLPRGRSAWLFDRFKE